MIGKRSPTRCTNSDAGSAECIAKLKATIAAMTREQLADGMLAVLCNLEARVISRKYLEGNIIKQSCKRQKNLKLKVYF